MEFNVVGKYANLKLGFTLVTNHVLSCVPTKIKVSSHVYHIHQVEHTLLRS